MRRKFFFFTLIFTLLLVGCVSPVGVSPVGVSLFAESYQDLTGDEDLIQSPSIVVPTEEPALFRGVDPDSDAQRMREDGYSLIGTSSFDGRNVDEDGAVAQARAVHASVVLVYTSHAGTPSGLVGAGGGAVSLARPSTKKSTTTTSRDVYKTGENGSFSGRASTASHGTQTTVIPNSVERYHYLATYWIKMKPPALGVQVKELTLEPGQQIGINRGLSVIAVVRNSPAWSAGILKDDIITKISNVEIVDIPTLQETLRECDGKKVTIEILRDGKTIVKEITLRNPELEQ